MKKWLLVGLFALLSLTLVTAGCSSGGGAANEIKIGVSAPLTGDISDIGQSTKNAALMAAEEVNSAGGLKVGDKKLKVNMIVGDDENKPESTANLFQRLINQDKVVAIVGSQASKCSNAGAPIAESAGVVQITPWSTNPNVTKDKKFVFRAAFIDPFQGKVNAIFAKNNLKVNTAAVLYDVASDYNKGLAEVFKEEFTKLGGQIVAFETYTTGDKDFSAQLTRIKAQSPDVLFLPNYYNEVPLQIQQAKRLGYNGKVLGGDAWDSPKIFDLGGKDLNGTYFSNHYAADADIPELKEFLKKYQAKYNAVPDAAGALTYDACRIIFQAIEKAGSTDRKAIRDAVAATKGFKGVTGTISYEGSGDPIKGAVILEIADGKYKYSATVNP
ncbi:MAG: ABC transporter substrate-binding protein [Bacillota bacterium]